MSRRDYVGEPESMDAILASDRFVEQLRTTGTFEPSSREDAALASLLLEWRDEVREAPITPPPRVDDDAVASIKQQPRRIAQRSVAVAGALLAMSSAAATAFDGDPLRPVRFLVDLGITVGEGIGNPDNDDSTEGVEPKSQEMTDEDGAADAPATSVESEEHGSNGPGSEDSTDDPRGPDDSEPTDPEGEPEGDLAMLTDPQPTDEVPDEQESEQPPAEEPGEGDPELPPETDEPSEEPSETPTEEPIEEPTETPAPTPADGEDNDGEGGGDDELPPESQSEHPDEPDPTQPPEQEPVAPDQSPGETPGDESGDEIDDGSAQSDWGDGDRGYGEWGDGEWGDGEWGDDWPSFWWTTWTESHSARH